MIVTTAVAAAVAAAIAAQAGVHAAVTAGEPTNTAPPTISGTQRQGSVLTASAGSWATDSSHPVTSYAYQWLRCASSCSAIGGATSQTYTLVSADVGTTIRVNVSATNSNGTSAPAQSAPTGTIAAADTPKNTAPPTISGSARAGQTLTASHGSWSGTAPISYAFQWRRCNTVGAACANVSGRTAATYPLSNSDVGHTLRVNVTATNTAGSSQVLSAQSPLVVAGGAAPTVARGPKLSGEAAVGKALTIDEGTWKGTGPIRFTYSWIRCDAKANNCGAIPGPDGSSYRPVGDDVGHRLVGVVVAHNADGTGRATTPPSAVVQGTPSTVGTPVISGTAKEGETLRATPGSWSSSSTISFAYIWLRCDAKGARCSQIPGAVSQTYVVSHDDVGHALVVQVNGKDAAGTRVAKSKPTGVVGASSAVPAASVSLPDRLSIAKVDFSPGRITSRAKPLVVRIRVVTTGGRPVSGAIVRAFAIPYSRVSKTADVTTDANGWAQLTYKVLRAMPIRKGYLLTLFVRAVKPAGDTLAGVSTRRLVSVPVG